MTGQSGKYSKLMTFRGRVEGEDDGFCQRVHGKLSIAWWFIYLEVIHSSTENIEEFIGSTRSIDELI
ncbi:MAG: hypothetical protein ACFFD4_28620 [Candidatus Odinarchaeota archaeon]